MPPNFLLYGANGYTGSLIAHLAVQSGLRPILAGRDKTRIEPLAAELGLDYRVFDLDDSSGLDAVLREVAVVLHCAGPFSRTSKPMADACLRTATHYTDITGEASVFESLAGRDAEAKAAGVMLLPGVGFDVVPSDCLAVHLKQRLPSATRLTLAIKGVGRLSHGTATTMVENIDRGGAVRRNGRIVAVPAAWKTRQVDFGKGEVTTTSIPWGDIATAFYSTGIPDIEVYAAIPGMTRRLMVASRYFGRILSTSVVQTFLKNRIKSLPAGPSEEERRRGKSYVWGRVENDTGESRTSRLAGPEGYQLTAMTSLAIVQRILRGEVFAGFQTPGKAFGPDLITAIDGVTRQDID
jgi:short subunit dehydrogenase-like uncharacterized protein